MQISYEVVFNAHMRQMTVSLSFDFLVLINFHWLPFGLMVNALSK